MSVFASVIIVVLVMLIQSFLQTSPSIFAIFYHQNLARVSMKKADDRALSFILGTEICVAIIFLLTYLTVSFFTRTVAPLSPIFLWIMSGLFLAYALMIFFFYFRWSGKSTKHPVKSFFQSLLPANSRPNSSSRSGSTELFLPRHLVRNLVTRAEHTKNRSDTILLGFIAAALDLIFTLPLYIIASLAIFSIAPTGGALFIIIYTIIATIPLFTIRILYRTDHRLADIQRLRVHLKPYLRLALSASFLALAIATLIAGVKL